MSAIHKRDSPKIGFFHKFTYFDEFQQILFYVDISFLFNFKKDWGFFKYFNNEYTSTFGKGNDILSGMASNTVEKLDNPETYNLKKYL